MFSIRQGATRPLILAAAASLAACAGGPDPDTASPSHMYAHYQQVGEIRAAVIAGDVGATRRPARWLASHEGDDFPAEAQDALERMRAEGRIILGQNEITDIAHSVARMGATCGSCHVATNGGPEIQIQDPPPASTELKAHMARHAWAMDRLWEGLIGPSDGAWTTGMAALTGSPLDFGTGPVPPQAEALAKRVHELAQEGRDAHDPKARAAVVGQLLESCALCHDVLNMRGH